MIGLKIAESMREIGITLILALFLTVKGDDQVNSGYYTAAVFEHARFGEFPKDTMPEIIQTNMMAYENATKTAAEKGADIIVFPEYGLHPEGNRTLYKQYAEYFPDPANVSWNPCISSSETKIARNLSCMAKENNIYLVANMLSKEPCTRSDPECPSDNVYIYNTNVVFNKKGKLVARFRKYHLYFEANIDIPKKFEYIVFKTQFGTFGTFVCFDIIWKSSVELLQKHYIDSIVYTLNWVEFLPMHSSIQTMSSWSFANNVNLLGANINHPSSASVGSGIFLGASRNAYYVFQPNGKSKLIVGKVPIRSSNILRTSDEATVMEFDNIWNGNVSSGECSRKILGPPKNSLDFRCTEINLSNSTMVKLRENKTSAKACNNGLCCSVNYEVVEMNEDYYLAVLNNTVEVSSYSETKTGRPYEIWEEVCMVVRCEQYQGKTCSVFPTKSSVVFKAFVMNANITSTHVYPSVLTSGMRLISPNKWSYTKNSLSVSTNDSLLFAVLDGRLYSKDQKYR